MKKDVRLLLAGVAVVSIGLWSAYQESAHRFDVVQFDNPMTNVVGEVGLGTLTGHTYTNDYFGLTIELPDEWYVQSRDEAEELTKISKSMFTGNGADPKLKAAIDANQTTSLRLLSAFQYPPGTPGLSNPSIIVLVERVRHLPGIRSGAEYCAQLKRALAMSALKPELGAVESGFKIGSLDAHRLSTQTKLGTDTIHQRYYAARFKDYVLTIAATNTTDEELELVEQILANIKTKAI